MIDSFILLAPVLLLLIVALFSFVGCFTKPDPPMARTPLFRINCGGPAVPDGDLEWTADDSPASGDRGSSQQNAGPLIDPTSSTPDRVYDSCRVAFTTNDPPNSSLSYEFMVGEGTVGVTLKFADIFATTQASFAFKINGGDTEIAETSYLVSMEAGGQFKKVDFARSIAVNSAGKLTITFQKALNQGNFAFINAIEVTK